jgi:4-hydroxy-4-methyl-2-oxoglutarate aldolase
MDACVRDGALMQAMGFPVFARGLCIRGTGQDFGATGWINHPVMIGDITVHAGDLVVGDGDGVVVIPQAHAGAIVQAGQQRDREEAQIIERLQAGETTMAVYGWGT